jgi:hypothetical protein
MTRWVGVGEMQEGWGGKRNEAGSRLIKAVEWSNSVEPPTLSAR